MFLDAIFRGNDRVRNVPMMKKISQLAYHNIYLIPELIDQYLLTTVQQPYSLQN